MFPFLLVSGGNSRLRRECTEGGDAGAPFARDEFSQRNARPWLRVGSLLLKLNRISEAGELALQILRVTSLAGGTSEVEELLDSGAPREEGAFAFFLETETEALRRMMPPAPALPGSRSEPLSICFSKEEDEAAPRVECPSAALDALLLLSQVAVRLGRPSRALRLCEEARSFAEKASLEDTESAARASWLAARILVNSQQGSSQNGGASSPSGACASPRRLFESGGRANSLDPSRASAFPLGEVEALTRRALKALALAGGSELERLFQSESVSRPVSAESERDACEALESAGVSEDSSVFEQVPLPALPFLGACGDGSEEGCAAAPSPHAEGLVVLGLELGETLQCQGTAAAEGEARFLVSFAASLLRRCREPSPRLCVRVWQKLLGQYRAAIESLLERRTSLRDGGGACPSQKSLSVSSAERSGEASGEAAKTVLKYLRLVFEVATFIDASCGRDRALLRALFSEALLFVLLLMATPVDVLLRPEAVRGGGVLKKALIASAVCLSSAMLSVERSASEREGQNASASLEASVLPPSAVRFLKALLR